jgi:integrase/recombinase XerD
LKESNLDIYQHERRFEKAKRNLEAAQDIPSANKKLILRFAEQLLLNGISKARATKYVLHLTMLARNSRILFEEFTRRDVERLVEWINAQEYAGHTIHDYKVIIKKFFQWLRGSNVEEHEYPEEVRWIKTTLQRNRILPDALLTKEDLERLVEAAENPRDKALILTHYDSGCRIGEILSLRIENIEFDKYGAVLRVNGKTGPRRVRVIGSAPALAEWLSIHPGRREPKNPVWIGMGTAGRYKPLDYYSARSIYQRLVKRAGLKKRVYTHLFRHTRATELANFLTEAQMKELLGWVQGSDMPSTYIHLSGRDVDSALLKAHGIAIEEKNPSQTFTLRSCPRCRQKLVSTSSFCPFCGLVTNDQAAVSLEGSLRKLDDVMNQLMMDEEFKDFLQKKIAQIYSSSMPLCKNGESRQFTEMTKVSSSPVGAKPKEHPANVKE